MKNNNRNANNYCHGKEIKKRKRRGSGGSGERNRRSMNSAKALGQISRIENSNNQRTRMLFSAFENTATFNNFAYDHS